jgi:hypothetical protein
MPNIAYFGPRFEDFKEAVGEIGEIFEVVDLQPNLLADIVVIDGEPTKQMTLGTGVVGVVSSDNIEGLRCLMKSGVRTVTCGMSQRNTVTLSSSVPNITICLRRKLPTMLGQVLEPAEYRSTQNDVECELVLLAAAVRLLCGKEPI